MENGGNIYESNTHDPIYYSIKERMSESVSCLVSYGVEVNREVEKGLSPLMYACQLGEREIAETLLAAGGIWLFSNDKSDELLRDLIELDSPTLLEGLLKQGLETNYLLFGALTLSDVADFYESKSVSAELSRRFPNRPSTHTRMDSLAKAPRLSGNRRIYYPEELQKKYGNLEVNVKVAALPTGEITLIKPDDSYPKEIRKLVASGINNWRFQRFKPKGSRSIYTTNIVVPLKVSVDEKDIFTIDNIDVMPRALFQVEPDYPPKLKEQKVSGWVKLEWVIDEFGRVQQAKAVRYSHAAFIEPAVKSILRSRWSPARRNGSPVAVRVRQDMAFNP